MLCNFNENTVHLKVIKLLRNGFCVLCPTKSYIQYTVELCNILNCYIVV